MYDQINKVLRWQALVGASCIVFFLVLSLEEGYSSMLGVAAVSLPNLVYGVALRFDKEAKRDVLRAGYRLIFLIANLVIVMTVFDVRPLGFFVTMVAVQLTFVLGLLQKD